MRAFIIRVVFIVIFLTGLGGLAEKAGLYFQTQEKDLIRLRESQAADLKAERSAQTRKIVVRRIQTENANECRMKIGPRLPNHFEQQFEVVREEMISP